MSTEAEACMASICDSEEFPEEAPEGSTILVIERDDENDVEGTWVPYMNPIYVFQDGSVLEVLDDWGQPSGCVVYESVDDVIRQAAAQSVTLRRKE